MKRLLIVGLLVVSLFVLSACQVQDESEDELVELLDEDLKEEYADVDKGNVVGEASRSKTSYRNRLVAEQIRRNQRSFTSRIGLTATQNSQGQIMVRNSRGDLVGVVGENGFIQTRGLIGERG